MPAASPEQRARNLEDLICELYVLFDAGHLTHFEHTTEEHRSGDGTLDIITATLADGSHARLTYGQCRIFLRGYHLAMKVRLERAAREPAGS